MQCMQAAEIGTHACEAQNFTSILAPVQSATAELMPVRNAGRSVCSTYQNG
jgi:hypothetical protein